MPDDALLGELAYKAEQFAHAYYGDAPLEEVEAWREALSVSCRNIDALENIERNLPRWRKELLTNVYTGPPRV